MIFRRLIVRLLFLAASASTAQVQAAINYATDIKVGDTVIAIPAPKEFALLPPEAQKYFDQLVTPNSEQFAIFLSETDVVSAKQGGIPDSGSRMFRVQTTKKLLPLFITNTQFTEIKSELKAQNESIIKKAEEETRGVMGKIIKGIADSNNVSLGDFGLSKVQMIPLPPHDDKERRLAYSMLVALEMKDSAGNAVLNEGVATLTCVHIKGKVLLLYVNAEKSGLEWSRSAAKHWVEAVIAANPSDSGTVAKETEPPRSWIDWGSVFRNAVFWGLIGLIVAIVRRQFKKP